MRKQQWQDTKYVSGSFGKNMSRAKKFRLCSHCFFTFNIAIDESGLLLYCCKKNIVC